MPYTPLDSGFIDNIGSMTDAEIKGYNQLSSAQNMVDFGVTPEQAAIIAPENTKYAKLKVASDEKQAQLDAITRSKQAQTIAQTGGIQDPALREQALQRIADQDYDLGDFAGDVATGIGVSAVNIGETLYTGLDLASEALIPGETGLDDILQGTAFKPQFEETRNILRDAGHSEQNKATAMLGQIADAKYEAGFEARVAQRQAEGIGDVRGFLEEQGGAFADTMDFLGKNPLAALNLISESSLELLAGGAAGKAGAGVAGKLATSKAKKAATKLKAANAKQAKAAAEVVAKRKATEAATKNAKSAQKLNRKTVAASQAAKQKATDAARLEARLAIKSKAAIDLAKSKGATTGATLYTGISEGFSNGNQAKREVLNTKHADLMKDSPKYREYLKEFNGDQAKAKKVLSEDAFTIATAIAGVTGMVAGKISGAGKFEGQLFTEAGLGKGLTNRISKVITGSVREGIEETSQGITGTLAGNIAKQKTSNEKQKLSEGLGKAAAEGLVAGVGTTVATSGVVQATGGVKDTLTQGVTKTAKAVNKVRSSAQQKTMTTAIETGDTSKLKTSEEKVVALADESVPIGAVSSVTPELATETAKVIDTNLEEINKNTVVLPEVKEELGDYIKAAEAYQAAAKALSTEEGNTPKNRAIMAEAAIHMLNANEATVIRAKAGNKNAEKAVFFIEHGAIATHGLFTLQSRYSAEDLNYVNEVVTKAENLSPGEVGSIKSGEPLATLTPDEKAELASMANRALYSVSTPEGNNMDPDSQERLARIALEQGVMNEAEANVLIEDANLKRLERVSSEIREGTDAGRDEAGKMSAKQHYHNIRAARETGDTATIQAAEKAYTTFRDDLQTKQQRIIEAKKEALAGIKTEGTGRDKQLVTPGKKIGVTDAEGNPILNQKGEQIVMDGTTLLGVNSANKYTRGFKADTAYFSAVDKQLAEAPKASELRQAAVAGPDAKLTPDTASRAVKDIKAAKGKFGITAKKKQVDKLSERSKEIYQSVVKRAGKLQLVGNVTNAEVATLLSEMEGISEVKKEVPSQKDLDARAKEDAKKEVEQKAKDDAAEDKRKADEAKATAERQAEFDKLSEEYENALDSVIEETPVTLPNAPIDAPVEVQQGYATAYTTLTNNGYTAKGLPSGETQFTPPKSEESVPTEDVLKPTTKPKVSRNLAKDHPNAAWVQRAQQIKDELSNKGITEPDQLLGLGLTKKALRFASNILSPNMKVIQPQQSAKVMDEYAKLIRGATAVLPDTEITPAPVPEAVTEIPSVEDPVQQGLELNFSSKADAAYNSDPNRKALRADLKKKAREANAKGLELEEEHRQKTIDNKQKQGTLFQPARIMLRNVTSLSGKGIKNVANFAKKSVIDQQWIAQNPLRTLFTASNARTPMNNIYGLVPAIDNIFSQFKNRELSTTDTKNELQALLGDLVDTSSINDFDVTELGGVPFLQRVVNTRLNETAMYFEGKYKKKGSEYNHRYLSAIRNDEGYSYKEPLLQFLVPTEDGGHVLDQHLIDAVAVSISAYINQYGNDTFNDYDAVQSLLGIEDADAGSIPTEAHRRLRHVGDTRSNVIKAMEKIIASNLGIKQTSGGMDVEQGIHRTLAAEAYSIMVNTGIITTVQIPAMEILGYQQEANKDVAESLASVTEANKKLAAAYKGEEGNSPKQEMWTYARIASNLDTAGKEITREGVNTSILGFKADGTEVFGHQFAVSMAETALKSSGLVSQLGNNKPTHLVKIGRTWDKRESMQILHNPYMVAPKKQVEANNLAEAIPLYLDEGMFQLYEAVGDAEYLLYSVMGYDHDAANRQKNVRIANEGKNLTIADAYKKLVGHKARMDSHKGDTFLTPFYTRYEYSKVMRQQGQGSFNPQNEKMHRFSTHVGVTGFSVAEGHMEDNSNKGYTHFMLAMAQAFGLDPDKNPNQVSGIAAKALLNDDPVTDKAKAIQAGLSELMEMYGSMEEGIEIYQPNQQVLIAAVKAGGEEMHTLQALTAYAQYLIAVESGGDKEGNFTHSAVVEIDGVTNGPYHNTLQLGLSGTTQEGEMGNLHLANKGGLIQGDKPEPINGMRDKYGKGYKDIYETVAELFGRFSGGLFGSIEEQFQEKVAKSKRGRVDRFPNYQIQGKAATPGKAVQFKYAFPIMVKYVDDVSAQAEGNGVRINARRGSTKTAVVAANYAAGGMGISNSKAAEVIDNLYKAMDDILVQASLTRNTNDPENREYYVSNHLYSDLLQLQEEINYISSSTEYTREGAINHGSKVSFVNPGATQFTSRKELADTLDKLDRFTFTPSQRKSVEYLMSETLGASLIVAIESIFRVHQSNTKEVSLATEFMHGAFITHYHDAIAKKHKESVKAGELASSQYITAEQHQEVLDEVFKIAPIFRSYFGDPDNLNEQIMSSKITTTSNKEVIGQDIPLSQQKPMGKGAGATTEISVPTFKSPGVATTPNTIISIDAAVQTLHTLFRPKATARNIFDALILALDDIDNANEAINAADYIVNRDYNMMQEVATTFKRSMDSSNISLVTPAFDTIIEKNSKKLADAYYAGDAEALSAAPVEEVIEHVLNNMQRIADKQQRLKEELLERGDISYNQFALLDYGIMIKDGQIVAATLEAIKEANAEYAKRDEVISESQLGQPTISPTHAWFKELAKGSNTVAELLSFSKSLLHPTEHQSELWESIPDNLEIHLVDSLPEQYPQNVDGLYVMHNGVPRIYIKNADEMTTERLEEVVKHELYHAATSGKINQYFINSASLAKDDRKAVKILIASAERLQALVGRLSPEKAATVPQGLLAILDEYATGDKARAINELGAFGSTNLKAITFLKKTPTTVAILHILNTISEAVKSLMGLSKKPSVFDALTVSTVLFNENTLLNQQPDTVLRSTDYSPKPVQQIFDELDQHSHHSDTHSQMLRGLIEQISKPLTDPLMTAYHEATKGVTTAPEQVFMDTFADGLKDAFTTLTTAGFALSPQEELVFKLYATAAEAGIANKFYSSKEIEKLYNIARDGLSAEDFLNPGVQLQNADFVQQRELGQERYDALFNHGAAGNKANFLAVFIAFTAIDPNMQSKIELLGTVKQNTQDSFSNLSVTQKLHHILNTLVNAINGKISVGETNPNVASALKSLTKDIVHVQAVKESLIDTWSNKVDDLEQASNRKIQSGVNKITEAIYTHTRGVADSYSGDSKILGSLAQSATIFGSLPYVFLNTKNAESVDILVDALVSAGTKKGNRMNFLAGLTTEFISLHERSLGVSDVQRRSSTTLDTEREGTREATATATREGFVSLTTEESHSLSAVGLRGDIGYLFTDAGYSLSDLVDLLNSSNNTLEKQINDLVSKISGLAIPRETRNYYINQAMHLGKTMATGSVYLETQMPNAISISKLVNTDFQVPADIDATSLIDELASLVAIQNTPDITRDTFLDVVLREVAENPTSNGITKMFTKHKALKDRELAKVGEGAEYRMAKGFAFELTSPHKSMVYATEKEGASLLNRGYVQGREIPRDVHDSKQVPLYEYHATEGGSLSWIQGAMSTLETTLGGISASTGKATTASVLSYGKGMTTNAIAARKKKASRRLGKQIINVSTPISTLVPSVNLAGKVDGYRYTLNNAQKDGKLERNNDVAEIMGAWDARINEEAHSIHFNKELVDVLHEQWNAAKGDKKRGFIPVSLNSKDPAIRELYRLLPAEMKEYAQGKFGDTPIMVHKRDLDNAFGYREPSILSMWDDEAKVNPSFRAVFLKLADALLGKNAAIVLRKGERGLQELVKEVKDFIVVKSIIVPAVNIISNMAQLAIRGVPLKDIWANSVKGVHAAKSYKLAMHELRSLKSRVEMTTDPKEIKKLDSRIKTIEAMQKNNPINGLVEAGLMPSIVEDISTQAVDYTFKGNIVSKLNSKIPKLGTNTASIIAKNALITQDSTAYSVLSDAIELGDFVAKYVLHEHYTKKQGMKAGESINKISSEFIDYGRLTTKQMDFLNRNGLTFFWKYFARIQPVIFDMIKNNPTKIMTLFASQGATGVNLATPLDSMFLGADIGAKTGIYDLMKGFFSLPALAMV